MSNWRLIIKVLGLLLFIEAGMMAVCFFAGMFYEENAMFAFLWAVLIASAIGSVNMYFGRNSGTNMSRRDGYLIVTVIWILFSLVGMLPFLFSGAAPDMSSAFFETMSGFTSTGATIIDNCDIQPHCILLWRSITQWVGGIGIIFFTVAILPAFGVGEIKLFAAESTGPLSNKVHPRISIAAKWIGSVYILLTTLCLTSLLLCGLNVFDAVNYSMTIIGTGGYGTHSDLLRDVYNNPTMEYVMTFFMLMAGINYTLLYYTILRGKIKKFFQDSEIKTFFFIFGGATVACTIGLMAYRISAQGIDTSSFSAFMSQLELSFREGIFTVVSMQTTTGLATCDYTQWPVALMPIILFVMFAGACSGSTSGGFKCARWSIIFKVTRNEFKRILHPRAVLPVKYNGQVLNIQVIRTLFGFVALFVGCLLIGTFVLALFGVDPNHGSTGQQFDYYEALGITMSSLSNVGPGMGYYGPVNSWSILSPFAKYVCSFLMLIGRLEIFPVLIIFYKGFWKKT